MTTRKRRPTSVTILGHEFQIKYVEDMSDSQYGEMTGWDRVIKINARLKGEEFYATLLHEICHSILFITGWSEKLGDEEEEGIVRALEHGLAPIIKLREVK